MGLSDTSTCFWSSSNIWTKDLFLFYCHWQYYFSAKFCIDAPYIWYLFRWSPYVTFFSYCSPTTLLREEPLQPVLIIRRDYQGLCWWHSHPFSQPPPPTYYIGTGHAFSLAFRGPKKSTCCCHPAPAMPQTHLSPDLMQVTSQVHWYARTWKVGLDLRRHWSWRHILTVQRGRTVWANPTLSQPLSSLFLFPGLNQCFFFFYSSQQHGIWLPATVPILHSPPQLFPPFICLGPLTLLSSVSSEKTLLHITGATETLVGLTWADRSSGLPPQGKGTT